MKHALVFWFTGLSGSGKTTVAVSTKKLLENEGYSVLVIDGDDVRKRLHSHLGFNEKDIKKNNELIADLCKTSLRRHDVIIVPIISPYASSRAQARKLLGEVFYEIYFSADLETVIKRDVKGLYSKAIRNEINNLIGYSPGSVYEPPARADFVVNSGGEGVNKSVVKFHEFVVAELKKRKS